MYGLYVASSFVYPDRPSVPKEYEGGLDKELGGEGAVLVCKTLGGKVERIVANHSSRHQRQETDQGAAYRVYIYLPLKIPINAISRISSIES